MGCGLLVNLIGQRHGQIHSQKKGQGQAHHALPPRSREANKVIRNSLFSKIQWQSVTSGSAGMADVGRMGLMELATMSTPVSLVWMVRPSNGEKEEFD